MKRFLENSAVLLVSIVMAAGLVYYAQHPAGGTTPPNEPAAKAEALEGAVLFSDAKIAAAGIELQTAGPGTLQDSILLNGMIQPNQEVLVQVTPRFPGIVRDVRKRIGDQVAKGDLLAAVESNQPKSVS
jgi:membrane fusion protein, heavy metal efflux system